MKKILALLLILAPVLVRASIHLIWENNAIWEGYTLVEGSTNLTDWNVVALLPPQFGTVDYLLPEDRPAYQFYRVSNWFQQ